jgi:hypothetical protein
MILNSDMNQWRNNLSGKSLQEVQLNEFSINHILEITINKEMVVI